MLLAVLLLFAAGAAYAAPNFPALSGRVVDQAELLNPAQEAELIRKLEALQRASTRQLVVATVPSLQGVPIEDYGYQLGRHWRIGQQGANNGVILLVAPTEKRVRIEVGYGLEPVLPDALASRIIEERILPRFRDRDFAGGIAAGTDAIIAQLQAPPEQAERNVQAAAGREQGARARAQERRGGTPWMLVVWLAVLGFIVFGALRSGLGGRRYRGRRRGWGGPVVIWGPGWGGRDRGRRTGGWGGGGGSGGGSSWGGGGGGGFSGGGGSFGGGGASGGW